MYGRHEEALEMVDEVIRSDPAGGRYKLKSRMLRSAPYGDDVEGFKLIHRMLKPNQFNRVDLTHLIMYSMDLDLPPLAQKYLNLAQLKAQDNPQILNRTIEVNCFLGKHNENIDLITIWANDKGMDPKEKARLLTWEYFHLDDYQRAEETLRSEYGELLNQCDAITDIPQLKIDFDNRGMVALYATLVRDKGETGKAEILADLICAFQQSRKEILPSAASGPDKDTWDMNCLALKGDGDGLAAKLDSIFFIDKNRLTDVFYALKLGAYQEFESNPNFLNVKNRITKETHRQRAEVIAYLKEEGDWDPAWDKELGLE
ncbi:hypothetical protein [Robiginitalea sp. IMCC43444]|uniref:hypothetical protein n=1 Tax=Robiginitalea sp. IMCC43444 TaxID=3459121 RepID=UPI0040419503